jgi:hypothetical protein
MTMFWGVFIVCSRGFFLVAPATALRSFRAIVETNARTRILGACMLLLAGPTIWAGNSDESALATVLLFLGWGIVGICIPALLLFPRLYMTIATAVLPIDSNASLFGWRIIGALGVMIGAIAFWFGLLAL